jgi:hypothetical protein
MDEMIMHYLRRLMGKLADVENETGAIGQHGELWEVFEEVTEFIEDVERIHGL